MSKSFGFRTRATEAPDHSMFDKLARLLQKLSSVNRWKDLEVGPMTDTVYAWYGAMEDWAYGAAWDTSPDSRVNECNPKSYPPFNKLEYNERFSHIKPAIYLIEASDMKHPSAKKFGNSQNRFCRNCDSDGHINRHIRLCLAFIESMSVYPVIVNTKFTADKQRIEIQWVYNGWLTLNEAVISVKDSTGSFVQTSKLKEATGYWNIGGKQTSFSHLLELSNSENDKIEFILGSLADQDFFEQKNPDPSLKPQTYVVQSRDVNSEYYLKTQRQYILL